MRATRSILLVCLAGVSVLACSGRGAEPSGAGATAEDTGTAGLNLQIAPGVSIGRLNWTIQNPALLAADRTGSVDVSQSSIIQLVVGGLPAGGGYTVTLGATASNGLSCAGSAAFGISANSTTDVTVLVTCSGDSADAGNNGSARVNGIIAIENSCAAVSSLSASPSAVDVGGVVALSAQGVDSLGQSSDVEFSWAVTAGTGSGTFSDTSLASPAFTCVSPGPVTVTVTASTPDGGASCRNNTASVDLTCSVAGGAATCGAHQTQCGASCVDTAIDMSNCGACGSSCPGGSVCTNGVCSASTSNWQMFGHDAQHTGSNPDEIGVPPSVDQWSVAIVPGGGSGGSFGRALSPAVVENGRAFVTYGTYFANYTPLVAVNVADGSPSWTYNFGYVSSVGHPAVSNGTVYVQTVGAVEDCFLWAFDAGAGSVTWTASFASQWANFWAPMIQGGTVYINGGTYGGLYGFGVTDGSPIFFNNAIGQYDSWSPAYFGGAVYSFVAGTFQASDPLTGQAIWSTTTSWNWTGYSMNTSAVFGPQLGYVVSPPNLLSVDPSSHQVAWTANASYTGTPAVSDGVVYAISAGSLVARDATTGVFLWTFVGDQNLSYPPAVANGYVYVSSAANVYAVRVTTHQAVWTAPVGGWVTVAAGRLLVAGPDGVLRGFVLSTP